MTMPMSMLAPIGYQAGDCGYCKQVTTSKRTPNSRASYYARTRSLSTAHYQDLVDRGWRRSGTLLYKPDPLRSCCPHYTVRVPALEFRATRDQRKSLNRWNRHVLGDKYIAEMNRRFPKTKEEKKHQDGSFDLTTTVHGAELAKLTKVEPEHRFEVTLEPDAFTEEKYALYADYQIHVHQETPSNISRAGFRRFLCDSPLHRTTASPQDPTAKQLGTFHHCYRVDGRLVALSVLDLLPHAVSGVYFIYHHEFEKWSFGKLSALREAALALEGEYNFYYMGYYIHSCPKMRYKCDYKPQHVLDLKTFGWDPLDDEVANMMEEKGYVSLSTERKRRGELPASTAKTTEGGGEEDEVGHELEDEDDGVLYKSPTEAMDAGLSVIELSIPGVLTLVTLHSEVDLDMMRVTLGKGRTHRMEEIVSWHDGSELEPKSLKGIVAEMAACIGPELAKEIVIDFGQ